MDDGANPSIYVPLKDQSEVVHSQQYAPTTEDSVRGRSLGCDTEITSWMLILPRSVLLDSPLRHAYVRDPLCGDYGLVATPDYGV